MEFQELKTGPFGYRKEDVYRYVNEQNSRYELLAKEKEELQKELEQSRSAEKQLKEAQERADALQKECDGLRAQAEDLRQQLAKSEEDSGSLRDARESISTAILHAEKYAAAVRRQADEKGAQIREKAETDAAEILRQAGLDAQTRLQEASRTAETQLRKASEKAAAILADAERRAGLENERARQVRARLEQSRGEIQSLSVQIDALLARAEDGIPDPGPEASGTAPADPDPAELVAGDA